MRMNKRMNIIKRRKTKLVEKAFILKMKVKLLAFCQEESRNQALQADRGHKIVAPTSKINQTIYGLVDIILGFTFSTGWI